MIAGCWKWRRNNCLSDGHKSEILSAFYSFSPFLFWLRVTAIYLWIKDAILLLSIQPPSPDSIYSFFFLKKTNVSVFFCKLVSLIIICNNHWPFFYDRWEELLYPLWDRHYSKQEMAESIFLVCSLICIARINEKFSLWCSGVVLVVDMM